MVSKNRLARFTMILSVCILGILGTAASAADAETLVAQGENAMSTGNYVAALKAFSQAAVLAPGNAAATRGLEQAELKLRQAAGDVSAQRITELVSELEQLDTEIKGSAREQIDALQKARDLAEQKAAGMEREIDQAKQQVAALQQKQAAADRQIAQLKNDLAEARQAATKAQQSESQKVRDLEAQVQKLETAKTQVAAEQKQLQSRIDALTQKNQQLNSQVQALQNDLAAARKAGDNAEEKKIEQLTQKLQAAEKQQQDTQRRLQTQVNQATEKNSMLSQQIKALENDLAAARQAAKKAGASDNERVQELQAQIRTFESQQAGTSREKQSLEAKIQNLEEQKELLVARLNELEQENWELKKAQKDTPAAAAPVAAADDRETKRLRQDLAAAEQKLTSARAQIEALESQREELRDQVQTLGKDVATARAAAGRNATARQVQNLEAENQELQQQAATCRRDKAQAEFRVKKLQLRCEEAMERLSRLEKQLATQQAQ